MPIAFDRTTCCDIEETISREWLITNDLGGYAAGTIAGTLTRKQHGLLVASPMAGRAPYTPQLLLAKLDEEIIFDQRTYYLGTNEYKDGTFNPAGFVHLEHFGLEEGFPVFTYHLGGIDGIVLEKRIWMPQGLNTTYIHYRLARTAPQETSGEQAFSQENPSSRVSRFLEDARVSSDSQRTLTLTLLPFVSYRPAHESLHGKLDWQFDVQPQVIRQDARAQESPQSIAGCTIRASEDALPYHIFAVGHPDSQATFLPTGVWYWNFLHREDQSSDDFYLPGVFRAKLWPGDDVELAIIVTTEDLSRQAFNLKQLKRACSEAIEDQRICAQSQTYFGEGGLAAHTRPALPFSFSEQPGELSPEEFLRTLLQAGKRFLAQRVLPPAESNSRPSLIFSEWQRYPTIFSSYYDLNERTRDMLIALPGLTLATGHDGEARRILLSLSRFFKGGLLPDRLPAPGQPLNDEDYLGIDTTLWYFYALDAYLLATGDDNTLEDLYPHLEACISSLANDIRNGRGVDKDDGLLLAHQPGKALTWMDALNDKGEPFTPRAGKPVEVNALWYHALSLMQEWSERLYRRGNVSMYQTLRKQCRKSFNERFWYEKGGYLYDVIDGPAGNDTSLRPNQLFSIALRYPVLDDSRWQVVVDVITQHLLTPCGLRSLAARCEGYSGRIPGRGSAMSEQARSALNGGAWPWLIGAYFDALCKVEGISQQQGRCDEGPAHKYTAWRAGVDLLDTHRKQLSTSMLGMPGSVYDGDEPQQSHGQPTSARSVAELLRVYKRISRLGVQSPDRTLSDRGLRFTS